MLGGILALAAAATFGLNSVAIRRGVLSGTVAQGKPGKPNDAAAD